jgi:exonuclease III
MEADPDKLMEMAAEIKPDIIMLKSLKGIDEDTVKELKFQKGMEHVMFFIYQ